MWYVKRELGMSTLFVGQEKKSELLPESYSPDVHWLRAQNHEMEQWILNWRVALPRAMQNVSSGDSSNSRKAPSLNAVFLHAFLPFPLLSFLHFWKCSPFWQPYEENNIYFGHWSLIWNWDAVRWAGVNSGTAMEQAGMEPFRLDHSPRAGTRSYYFEIQRFEVVQPDAVAVSWVAVGELMGLESLCLRSCLVPLLLLFDWQR